MSGDNNQSGNGGSALTGTFAVKVGLAQMLKGGVIMDVVTPEHARIAEEAGACAVMARRSWSQRPKWLFASAYSRPMLVEPRTGSSVLRLTETPASRNLGKG